MNLIQMKKFLLVLFLLGGNSSWAGPDYANEKTKEVIQAMVQAHGGIEKWRSLPAISFDNIMHNNYHGKN